MNDVFETISHLLNNVILPNLQVVRDRQKEQIAANDRIEHDIEELRLELESQFANLNAQLTACRAELAATQAILSAANLTEAGVDIKLPALVH